MKEKHENAKLKVNVPRAILLREKPEEGKSIVAFRSKRTHSRSLETSCLWYSIKFKTRGVPEVICAQRYKTNYISRHTSRWLLDLSPPPPNNSERSDFVISSRAKRARSLLPARGLSQLRNSRPHK